MKLAEQGLNVVLVALGDPLLDATLCELQAAFPAATFRKVCFQVLRWRGAHVLSHTPFEFAAGAVDAQRRFLSIGIIK
jgi:hypothetical protein